MLKAAEDKPATVWLPDRVPVMLSEAEPVMLVSAATQRGKRCAWAGRTGFALNGRAPVLC